jgi:hypothetical protein
LEREKVASDSNHVPTSVDAYTDDALKEWFADRDIATVLLLSLNKNRLSNLGSNFTDYKKLGFPNEAALTQAHRGTCPAAGLVAKMRLECAHLTRSAG